MITMYGIKNCDTIKKARQWLTKNGIEYHFHDYRMDGVDKKQVQQWCKSLGWEQLLNRRGTTWRQLPEHIKESISETKAISLMVDHPTLIKRPVLVSGKKTHVGFNEEDYKKLL